MMPVGVGMLVAMLSGLVLMFLPVMAMGTSLVAMLMLMLVFVGAAHLGFTSLVIFLYKR
jgi:hypothetical protein